MGLQTELGVETAPAFAQATAARNLQLLRAIETTVISVESATRLTDVVAREASDMLARLQKANVSFALDPSGVACKDFGEASDIVSGLYADARAKHQYARKDFRLTGDDGVADAYNAYMAALKDAHDAIEELREWVETHDAILEPSSGKVYSNVDDLFAAMGL